MSQKMKYWTITFIVLALAALLFLYPTSLYIKKPGQAYGASNYIKVENRDTDDVGEFRFTTVAVMQGTPFSLGLALFMPHHDIVERKEVFREEEDPEEYHVRQMQLMDSSKFSAISVAYKEAGYEVQERFHGLSVLNVLDNSAAYGKLQTGDLIVKVAGKTLKSTEQFLQLLEGKKKGDKVKLEVKRNKKIIELTIPLKEIPKAAGKIGLGITYTDSKSIQSEPPVKMDTEDIGGPSAGLMFTLEILNQLLAEDITKGYNIAGTGTMNEDGTIGRIGGIDKKVVAAAKAGAQYFLAPDDDLTEELLAINPTLKTNYEEALLAMKDIDSEMEVVPVKTIDDAIQFLQQLQPKNE